MPKFLKSVEVHIQITVNVQETLVEQNNDKSKSPTAAGVRIPFFSDSCNKYDDFLITKINLFLCGKLTDAEIKWQ